MSGKKTGNQTEKTGTFHFKAETKQLLNILIHSLYKEREVFLRELISNASDALNRMRFEMLTNREVIDPDRELGIHIQVNKEAGEIRIQDSGIGMTRDEIIENLGTIAQSGAREFIKAAGEDNPNLLQVIGQFGVGFYSVFMVADQVTVISRSYRPDAGAISWRAAGEDEYQVEPAEMLERGTHVVVKLKEDAKEFADEYRLKEIIRKHSDYVGFPITVGDDKAPVNRQTSIWRTPRQDVTEEQYKDFYRQLTLELDDPLLHIQMAADAPVQVYAMLYIPAKLERGILSLRRQDGLKLYSKNILIDEYSKDLLPEYLHFIQGVVDSEDLPLNVSRETIQATGMMGKLKKILTGQVLKDLQELARSDAEKYQVFWSEFGMSLKQGIASNQPESEQLQALLRFRTSTQPESWSSLEDYIQRMQTGQKEIYYIIGDDPQSILRSPHLDHFGDRQVEVLLLTEPMDAFMLMGLRKYKEFELKNAAGTEVSLPEIEKPTSDGQPAANPAESENLIAIFKKQLGDKVADVRTTTRLTRSVARLVDEAGGMGPELQRVYRYLEKDFKAPQKILELNPSHPLLTKLAALESGDQLQNEIIDQIYESALLMEGMHPDPAGMVDRLEQIMEAAVDGKQAKTGFKFTKLGKDEIKNR